MSNKQEAIEPEIVHEIPKQKKRNVKVGKNKKELSWVFLILAVIYMLSPIDIIPDLIPVLGWGDDVVVGVLAFINFLNQQKK
jgi:uncharacterized membrane protein YkvA (DUF1232 family)